MEICLKSFIIVFVSNLYLLLFSSHTSAKTALPILENIGHIPVQWIGMDDDSLLLYSGFKEKVDSASGIILAESNRFHIINEELIQNLWSNLAGREELREDFELDAFFNLFVTKKADHFLFEARLLSSNLEIYLVEQDFITKIDAQNKSFGEIRTKLSELFYKMLNRLPIDVIVTSIQGRYITLNGGINQGIHYGDSMEIFRAKVSATHPAHGGWKNFETKLMGKVKIIDSQSASSVGVIESQPYEGAIAIGDGSKVSRIVPRSFYALKDRGEKKENFESILIPSGQSKAKPTDSTIKNPNEQKNIAQAAKMEPSQPAPTAIIPSTNDDNASSSSYPPPSPNNQNGPPPATDSKPVEGDSGSSPDAQPFQDYLANVADELSIAFGQGTWNYNGPGTTGSKFMWYYPINFLNARVTRQLADKLKYGIGGGLSFGKTKNSGAYFGYDGHVRAFWEDKLPLEDLGLKKWQAGANGRFTGLGVSLEGYGGGDVVMGGVFGALHGQIPISGENFNWLAEYSITPLTIGRIGYGGSRKVIRSSLGWEFIAQIVQAKSGAADKRIRWGGTIGTGNHRVLDNAGNETSKSHVNLAAVAQMQL